MGKLAGSYTNFDDLLADISTGVKEIVEDIAPQIETKLQESAEKNVHPKNVNLARDGGITAAKNIVSSVTSDGTTTTLIVKDIAKPRYSRFGTYFNESQDAAVGGTTFASWIENAGSGNFMGWMDLEHYLRSGGEKRSRPARPFIAPAQVDAVLLIQAALKGL